MHKQRIEQAQNQFNHYLAEELLKKANFDQHILEKYEENALESLVVAQNLFDRKISFLWTIVSSYYAMFYIACAYVYTKGYKTQHKIVHKIIADALITLAKNDLEQYFLDSYTQEQEKALSIAENLLESLDFERAKRSTFQYETSAEIKEVKAKTSLQRAKEFVTVLRNLMLQKNF